MTEEEAIGPAMEPAVPVNGFYAASDILPMLKVLNVEISELKAFALLRGMKAHSEGLNYSQLPEFRNPDVLNS